MKTLFIPQKRLTLSLPLALALIVSGCSTLNVQKDQVAKVKTVAVVGFSIIQDVPVTPTISLAFGSKDNSMSSGFNGALCENRSHAQLIEKNLTDHLAKDMGWKLVDAVVVQKSPIIDQTLQWQHSNGRPLQMIPSKTKCYTDENIPEAFAFERKSLEERRQVMKDLGVDAVIVAQVRVELENSSILSIVGGAEYQPRSTLNFAVYNAEQEDPIWRDTWARGEPEEKGIVAWMGFTNNDKLTAKIVSSSQSAFDKLVAFSVARIRSESSTNL